MKQPCQKRLARFLRDLSSETDSSKTAILSLSALNNALGSLNCPGDLARSTITDLIAMIRGARPESVPLTHLLDFLEQDIAQGLTSEMEPAAARDLAVRKINDRICQARRTADALAERGAGYVAHGHRILLIGAGEPLIRSLVLARTENHLDFEVVAAQVYPDQPRRLTAAFLRAGIPLDFVRPEDLDHSFGHIDTLFLGPMPVTRERKVLAPKGTAEILRYCRARGIGVHFFADTLHYEGRGAGSHVPRGPETFVPARDIIDLGRMDHIVTEIGEVNLAGGLLSGTCSLEDGQTKTGAETGPAKGICCPELIPA